MKKLIDLFWPIFLLLGGLIALFIYVIGFKIIIALIIGTLLIFGGLFLISKIKGSIKK